MALEEPFAAILHVHIILAYIHMQQYFNKACCHHEHIIMTK